MREIAKLSCAVLCAGVLSLGISLPAAEAAPAARAAGHMAKTLKAPLPYIHKAHSKMHPNCANHAGSYHNHKPVYKRYCASWVYRPGPRGSRERVCNAWRQTRVGYRINICPR